VVLTFVNDKRPNISEWEVTASSTIPRRILGSYTNKKSRTFLDGKRVTIQSMERAGNKIEDKYVDKYVGWNGV
jgi:hypothetical protein